MALIGKTVRLSNLDVAKNRVVSRLPFWKVSDHCVGLIRSLHTFAGEG